MDTLFSDNFLFPGGAETRPRQEIAPGAVHLPGWLTLEQQRFLADRFRSWAAGPVPARRAVMPGGYPMSVRTVCLGWHWQPYSYTREARDVNGQRVLEFPDWLADVGRRALVDAYQDPHSGDDYRPDAALANYYDADAKMGMHQDREERVNQPVVSLSIGDSCIFRFGNPDTRTKPYIDVTLASGDLFVFGGPSRFAYHGVTRVLPGSAPANCGLAQGRINLTMRVTGLQ